MIMAVPTRRDEDRMDHAENAGRSGVPAAVVLGALVFVVVVWLAVR